jgi:hypothetical protein
MANVNKPFGLRPLGNLSATGAQKQYGYLIASGYGTAIYQGDLVVVYDGYIIKYDASTHTAPTGVFNGCQYNDPTRADKPTWKNYYPVVLLPTLAASCVKFRTILANCLLCKQTVQLLKPILARMLTQLHLTTGSTYSGISNGSLGSASIAKTAALTFKIVGLYDTPNNAFGTYAQVVVKLNQHQYGSVGVAADGA